MTRRPPRHPARQALAALGLGLLVATGGISLALVGGAPAGADDCVPTPPSPVPTLPGVPPLPTPTPVPCPLPTSATPQPTDTTTPTPVATFEPGPSDTGVPLPTDTGGGVLPPPPVDIPGVLPAGDLTGPTVEPAPQPTVAGQGGQPSVAAVALPVPVSGALAFTVGGLLAAALLLSLLATSARAAVATNRVRSRRIGTLALIASGSPSLAELSHAASTHAASTHAAHPGGTPMSDTRRWRLITGAALLGLAAIVGFVGWYKVSGEPLVNRELSYLVSAGVAAMILAVAGGAILVAEQMRTDDRRLDDIEDAVRSLVMAMAPSIERPARLRDEPAEEPANVEVVESSTRGRRTPKP